MRRVMKDMFTSIHPGGGSNSTSNRNNNNTNNNTNDDHNDHIITQQLLDVEEAETTTFHNVVTTATSAAAASSSVGSTTTAIHRSGTNSVSLLSADRAYQSLLRSELDNDDDDDDDDDGDDYNTIGGTFDTQQRQQQQQQRHNLQMMNLQQQQQQQQHHQYHHTNLVPSSSSSSNRFRTVVKKIRILKSMKKLQEEQQTNSNNNNNSSSTVTSDNAATNNTNQSGYTTKKSEEGVPLLQQQHHYQGSNKNHNNSKKNNNTSDSNDYGTTMTQTAIYNTVWKNNNNGNGSSNNMIWQYMKHKTFQVSYIMNCIRYCILHSFIVWIGLPMTILSFILYYHFNDIELDFLPGQISLSWWTGNFITRQVITLDVTRLLHYILLEKNILFGKQGFIVTVKKLFGFAGMVSHLCTHAKGWPAIFIGWSFIDLLVLHGDNNYAKQWFTFTGYSIYSYTASYNGNNLLNSVLYLRLLLSMLLAGIATSMKRFILEYQMKERQCMAFKSRLEKLLLEIIVIADIANLSEQVPTIQSMMVKSDDNNDTNNSVQSQQSIIPSTSNISEHFISDLSNIDEAMTDDDNKDELFVSENITRELRPQLSSMNVSEMLIKDLLDPWEPPENKANKNNASFRQVLRFQRALNFINADDPFGEAFGPTDDRDSCIRSSMNLYTKLVPLNTPVDPVLDFDVLLLAIYNDDGIPDPVKKKVLERLFRPDAKHNVTQLAFVQSCDAVYKRLRYFQASVGNASVLDNVLTSIVDSIFYFILLLLILSMLQFDPWTLLVSMTSLLVSISFAMGSSVSKYVEGLQLIAVVRPFDLGDRIYIGPPDTTAGYVPPGGTIDISHCTWFVEDITVSTTTLRFARTNEVSTINNWAIAGSKIINCNRSPNALVVFNTTLHVSIFQNNTLDIFKAELQDYVATRPRIWDSLQFCRHDSIDADNEQVAFQISFRHRNSWQDAGRIKLHRADLTRFIYELSVKLQVHFETPPPRQLVYNGGALQQGQVQDFKRNLLTGDNIRNVERNRAMSMNDDALQFLNPESQMTKVHSTSDPLLKKD